MLATGIQGEKKEQVTQENTALTMKSGALKVYATPAMIALMEQAAYTSVARRVRGRTGNCRNTDECQPYFCDSGRHGSNSKERVSKKSMEENWFSMWKRMMNVEKSAKASMSVLSSTMKNSRTRQITNKESK